MNEPREVPPAIESALRGKTHVALIKDSAGLHTEFLTIEDGTEVDVDAWNRKMALVGKTKDVELLDVITADQFRQRMKDPSLSNVSTPSERKEWIRRGVGEGATHMIVVTDTFSNEDYPVFVKPGEDPATIKAEYDGKNMQRVVESFDLGVDTEASIDAEGYVMRI